MDDNIYLQGLQESLDFWKTRVDAPDDVLRVLHTHDHLVNMKTASMAMGFDLDTLMQELGEDLMNAQKPWNAQPVEKTKKSIEKLSRGFAMAAEDVAGFFKDIDLGREIRDSLLDPKSPPREYPNMFVSAGYIFLKEIESILPEEFWRTDPDFPEIRMAADFMSETGLSNIRGEPKTPLVFFMHHQRLARVLDRAAPELKKAKKHNWATIAQALADKNNAAVKDISTRARAFNEKHDLQANLLEAENFTLPSAVKAPRP
jgi:hypothetical protein